MTRRNILDIALVLISLTLAVHIVVGLVTMDWPYTVNGITKAIAFAAGIAIGRYRR